MGNSPLKDGDRVEQSRETEHLVVFEGQFSSLTKKKTVEPNLVILMVFFVALGLFLTYEQDSSCINLSKMNQRRRYDSKVPRHPQYVASLIKNGIYFLLRWATHSLKLRTISVSST